MPEELKGCLCKVADAILHLCTTSVVCSSWIAAWATLIQGTTWLCPSPSMAEKLQKDLESIWTGQPLGPWSRQARKLLAGGNVCDNVKCFEIKHKHVTENKILSSSNSPVRSADLTATSSHTFPTPALNSCLGGATGLRFKHRFFSVSVAADKSAS